MCAPEVGLVSVPGRTVSNGLSRRSVWSRGDTNLSWMFICSCLYLCLLHLYSHHSTVPLTVLLFDFVSVISVEALCDCADVGLPVHPDLSQNPLTLLQPLGSVQLWWCTHDTCTKTKQNKKRVRACQHIVHSHNRQVRSQSHTVMPREMNSESVHMKKKSKWNLPFPVNGLRLSITAPSQKCKG